MSDDTQMVKGILEGCLLKILSMGGVYGYKAVEVLNLAGFEVSEATVYPMLTRLQVKGLLRVEKGPSPSGPDRKYYYLTGEGAASLAEFARAWLRIEGIVNRIMGGNSGDTQK